MTLIYVAKNGSRAGDGSADNPFLTINQAAAVAQPGDTVVVGEGEYREWVQPEFGGESDLRRITYQPAEGAKVSIKGSERIEDWENVSGTTWKAVVPNSLFGDFNPFDTEVDGDWIVYYEPAGRAHKHLGDVYLNGKSFYEASSVEEVNEGATQTEVKDDWTGVMVPAHDPEGSKYLWYAEVMEDTTTIWANFHGADPTEELVEINVRPAVFFPKKHHLDYITVRGFELSQAAPQWAPPTADQPGLIGPNWAKGWVIEDNIIHDAKCSGVSIGKEGSTGHNLFTLRKDKPGYQYQLESVFSARQIGWDKEHIGSHVIRRNEIYDCGQTGIVGHLGCVFSKIQDNNIHDIAMKREFYGYEIGGIKLHAAIDVVIEHNRIHDTSLGLWLDWQTQGTRITRNLFYDNNRDIFVEVSHGPYVVDNNVFASPAAIETFSQGGAYVNNLILGAVRLEPVMDRSTPYHKPHSTQVAGFAVIYAGDDRFVGNIFAGQEEGAQDAYAEGGQSTPDFSYGTSVYDGHPATFEEYMERINAQPEGDHQMYPSVKQAVYIRDNVYADGATAYADETGAVTVEGLKVTIEEDGDNVYLVVDAPKALADVQLPTVTGEDLEPVRFVRANFEDLDGSPIVIDEDVRGTKRPALGTSSAGPVADLVEGESRYQVW